MGKGKIKAPRGAVKRSEKSHNSDLDDYTPEAFFYNDEEKTLASMVS